MAFGSDLPGNTNMGQADVAPYNIEAYGSRYFTHVSVPSFNYGK